METKLYVQNNTSERGGIWSCLLTATQIGDILGPEQVYPGVARKLFYRSGFYIPTLLQICQEPRHLVWSQFVMTKMRMRVPLYLRVTERFNGPGSTLERASFIFQAPSNWTTTFSRASWLRFDNWLSGFLIAGGPKTTTSYRA